MKSIRSLLLAPIALALVVASTLSADPAGTWVWTHDTPQGKSMTSSLSLQTADGKLTGALTGFRGSTPISEGIYTKDSLSFSVVRTTRDGETRVTKYQGKVEGDTITGTVDMPAWRDGEAKKMDWVAHRSTTPAAVSPAPSN